MSADPSLDILAMSAACSPIFPSKSIAMSSISTPPPELPARAGCAAKAMQKIPQNAHNLFIKLDIKRPRFYIKSR